MTFKWRHCGVLAIPLMFFFLCKPTAFAQTKAVVAGKVIDAQTGIGIEYASVAAYHPDSIAPVEGVLTDGQGAFRLGLPQGTYRLRVRFIGYQEAVLDAVEVRDAPLDLGEIGLLIGEETLQEVVVSGDKTLMRHQVDRQIYSSGDFQASTGGTAIDLLKNLPSMSLDAEGELSVRGTSGFVILLNGKPVQADAISLLNQLPANSIEDIEVITAPSARYDPEGKAGMINIITKKGASDGLYLLTNIILGAPSMDTYDNSQTAYRYGGDFTMNFRSDKWDISWGADYGRNDNAGFREGLVETFRGDTITSLPSVGERSYRKENYSGRAVIGYALTPRDQINAAVYAGVRSEYRTADLLYHQKRHISGTGSAFESQVYFNENGRERTSEFFIGSLDYTKQFKDRSSLNLSGLYEKTVLGGPTKNLNRNPEILSDTINYQVMEEYNPLDGIRFNVDYSRPLGENSNLQLGYQYRWLEHVGEFEYNEKILGENRFITLPEFSSNIILNRKINSFYGEYSYRTEQLVLNLGARAEHTDRILHDYSKDERYVFNQWNIFPSASLNVNTENGLIWKASYSRRIERTTTNMMNPFLARRHSEVLEVGDPNLKPELVDAVEVGLVKDFERISLFANVYYRKVSDVINQVNSVYNDSILYRTYTNAGVSKVKGLEVAADMNPLDWWKVYVGGTLYQFDIRGRVIGEDIQRNSWNYSFNLNTSADLGHNWDASFNLNYLSRTVTIQGEKSRFFSPNLTLRKSLMQDRLTFSLQWKHIALGWLDSNRQRIVGRGEGFLTNTNYISERDVVALTVSYRINQLAKKINFNKSEFGEREF